MRQKRKKPVFVPPKRCMVFADGLDWIGVYQSLAKFSQVLSHLANIS